MEPARSDEELMEAYVGGDESAFRVLFERFAPVLLRVVRRNVGSDTEAQDVVQQTFLQMHRARADFRPGARLRPWLFTIALNLAREVHRRRGRRRESDLDQSGVEPSMDAPASIGEGDADARRVRAALDALPAAQREVIVLHWLEDRPFPEVATIVGASLTAVKVRAHRGYERLRAALGGTRGQGEE